MRKLTVPIPLHVWQCDWCGYIWEEGLLPKYDSARYQPCKNCNMRGYVHFLHMEDSHDQQARKD